MKTLIALISILFIVIGCNADRDQLIGQGPSELDIEFEGINREFILYMPDGLEKNAPLVFVCHGYTGTAKGVMDYSKMNAVADSNGFAVCYPQGTQGGNMKNFWQVGYSFNEKDTVDDVGFLEHLAVKLQKDYKLSKNNTFITGMSNGGDMCNLLAASSSKVFKVTAPVVGCLMKWFIDSYPDPDPKPILLINGTNDNVTLWDGDLADKDGWGPYHPTDEMFNFWIKTNNCTELEKELIPNANTEDGSHIILERHHGPEALAPVWIYKVIGGGHDWPGSSGNMDISASEVIWSFFKRHLE